MNFFDLTNLDILGYTFQFLDFQEQAKIASVSKATNQIAQNSFHSAIKKIEKLNKNDLFCYCQSKLYDMIENEDLTFHCLASGLFYYKRFPVYQQQLGLCMMFAKSRMNNKLKSIVQQLAYCKKFKDIFSIKQICQNIDYSVMLSVQFKNNVEMGAPYNWFIYTDEEERNVLVKLKFQPEGEFKTLQFFTYNLIDMKVFN